MSSDWSINPKAITSPSPGHLDGKTDALKVRLIAEESGIGLFEESKNGLIYGYTLAVMPAKNKDYGRNAWYLPNWVREYAVAAIPKLGAELAKPKKERRALREVLALHREEWRDWLAERDPLKPVRPGNRELTRKARNPAVRTGDQR
jgi:hypothetical protein